jgi:hypothetical protein
MNNNNDIRVNLNSKDAVYYALARQTGQLIMIVLVASLGVPCLLWMFGNFNNSLKLDDQWEAVYSQCKRVNINKTGRYSHNDCYEWAQQQVPGRYERRYYAHLDNRSVEQPSTHY